MMKGISKCLSVACALGMLLAFASRASAQDDKCRDKVYNTARKVLDQEAKNNRKACVKGLSGDQTACVDAEAAKAESQEGKIEGEFADGKCTTIPAFGIVTASTPLGDDIGDAMQAAADNVIRRTFGNPVDGLDGSKCNDKIAQRPGQQAVAIAKAFRKCAQGAANIGAIEGCVGTGIADPKAGSKATKLAADVAGKCIDDMDAPINPPPGTDDGDCGAAVDQAAFSACVSNLVDCEVCKAINAMTGGAANCEMLDNGAADNSCPGGSPLGNHKCTLDETPTVCLGGGNDGDPCTAPSDCPSGTCLQRSRIEVNAHVVVPITVPVNSSGAIDISCGAVDEGTGKATCSCSIQTFDALPLPPIGVVCVTPGSPCASGEVDCDGGNILGVDMSSDANIGACTDNTDCSTQCDTFCVGSGARFDSGCTGFCNGGANDNDPCNEETDCPGGACNGPDPVGANDGICQCTCVDQASGPASAAGDIACNLSSNIVVEDAAPCDGTDIGIVVGDTCIPLTTQTAATNLTDANFGASPDLSGTNTGAGLACTTLETSTTTGLSLVGVANFFGSALGDLAVEVISTCQ